jgi:nickel-type superoxide dismutase maturation protease
MVRIVRLVAYHAPMRSVVSFFLRRIVVEGASMMPTFPDGTTLLAVRRWRAVRVGDVVVAPDPREPGRLLLKRCVARQGGLLDIRGDNPSFSTDSRNFGLVPARQVRYLVRDAGRES